MPKDKDFQWLLENLKPFVNHQMSQDTKDCFEKMEKRIESNHKEIMDKFENLGKKYSGKWVEVVLGMAILGILAWNWRLFSGLISVAHALMIQ